MPTFRLLNQAPQYLLPSGDVNAGGKLYFYETDLTTPKNTWSDPDKSVLNSNPVVMDSDGRTSTDIWLDGEYGVVMKNAANTTIWTRNNVRSGAEIGTALPAPSTGPDKFLQSNGTEYILSDVLQVPDPTGLSNYILGSDGEQPIWIQPPAPAVVPEGGVVLVTGGFRIGNQMFLCGSDTAPASGTVSTSKSVSFPTAFTGTPKIQVTITGSQTQNGYFIDEQVNAKSNTGFTAAFNGDHGDAPFGAGNINQVVPFDWFAVGPVAA